MAYRGSSALFVDLSSEHVETEAKERVRVVQSKSAAFLHLPVSRRNPRTTEPKDRS
jgi:hypothetical protein